MKRGNGFEKDPERAREAGRKSRKSGPGIKTILRQILESDAPADWVEQLEANGLKINKTVMDVLQGKLVAMALKGDLKALQEIHNRLEGKPRETIEFDQDEPLRIEFINKTIEEKNQ